MTHLALLVSILMWWLSACTASPAPHDSSTRVLNEMKVERIVDTSPSSAVAAPDARVAALEQRLRDLELLEARNRELEALLATEREKLASLSAPGSAERVATKTYDDLVARLQPEIDKGNIHVTRQGDRVTITLADRLLFNSGSDRLKTAGVQVLEHVGHVLHERPDMRIQVDGHTDNVPIGEKLQAKFPTNVALSQARANHVADALRAAGVSAMNLDAAGYGEQRPVANNMVENGRRKNRRVELIAFPRQN